MATDVNVPLAISLGVISSQVIVVILIPSSFEQWLSYKVTHVYMLLPSFPLAFLPINTYNHRGRYLTS